MLNERTASYLAEEVRKAQAELETLNAQTRELDARREAAQIKLEALRHALGPGAPSGAPSVPAAGQADFLIHASPVVSESNEQDQPAIGFRSAIRAILNEANGKGLRPMEIFDRMKERGIVYRGKTSPAVRTGSELYRMVREGHARKRGKLFYAMPVSAESNGGTQPS